MFFMEAMMEHVASVGGFDPAMLRQINLCQQGQVTPYQQPINYCSLDTLWQQFVTSTNHQAKVQDVLAFNTANRWRKRGIALQPLK